MRKILALGAAAALTIIGVGTASTAAQADEVGTSAFTDVMISEVLIDTVEPTQQGLGQISSVEVIKPASNTEADKIDGYQIQACGATSIQPVTVRTLDSNTEDKDRIAVAEPTGWTYQTTTAFPLATNIGGVRIVNASGTYIDGVVFDSTNPIVAACMKFDNQNVTPASSPAPTATESATRISDTGSFALRTPTFAQVNGAANPTS